MLDPGSDGLKGRKRLSSRSSQRRPAELQRGTRNAQGEDEVRDEELEDMMKMGKILPSVPTVSSQNRFSN